MRLLLYNWMIYIISKYEYLFPDIWMSENSACEQFIILTSEKINYICFSKIKMPNCTCEQQGQCECNEKIRGYEIIYILFLPKAIICK